VKRTGLKTKNKKADWKTVIGGRRGWLAMGTLAAYAVMGSSRGAMAAVAKDAGAGASGVGAPAANLPVKRFHIGAGPLDEAIKDYEQVTGLTVKITLPSGTLAGFTTHGVNGLHTVEEGLRLLLEGSGLSYAAQDSTTMVVGLHNSDSVDVTASMSDGVSMTKFTQPLIDTPQTVAVVPQFVLHDQQNTTLKDALRNVPGISMAAGEFGAQGDNLTIRGFTARNDIFLDGIRDFGSYYRDSFNYDQVEVLEGPAGVEFGRGSTGGIINQESKVPAAQPFVNVQTQFGTDATRRVSADVNEPLNDFVEGAAVRVNAVGVAGGVAGRPFAANSHYGIAPSLSFGLNSPTRFTISYFHMTESDTPDYGLPWLFNKLSPANRHAYFGFPDSNILRADVDIVTGKFEHNFNEHLQLHSIGRWANYGRHAQITEPQICSNASQAIPVGGFVSALPTSSVTGATCAYTPTTPANQIAVNRNQLQVRSVEGDLWDQTELTARFKAFGLRNEFSGGVEGGQEISNPVRTTYKNVTPANLANPNPADPFSGTGTVASVTHTKSESVGLYFVDTVHLGRMFDLSGGVRWDYFDTNYNLYVPNSATGNIGPLEQVVHQPSYRAAFVFKPNTHGSVYFDYGTSFNPSAESLSLSVSTSVLPPEENETYEVGAKYSLLNERLMLDGAWFRTTKLNARETDPTNSNNIVLAGNQLVHGVQASAVGRLTHGTDLVLGYAYLHSEVLSSKFFPTSVGYQLANVPKETFNAFLTRNLFAGVKGGFGGNYVASRTASSTVPFMPLTFGPLTAYADPTTGAPKQGYQVLSTGMKQVPGYWVFNAMMSRPITDRLELQANVYNLLNRFYIDQPHPSHLIPGAGVSALIGLNFKF
jgi:catecholate siderophore receptor